MIYRLTALYLAVIPLVVKLFFVPLAAFIVVNHSNLAQHIRIIRILGCYLDKLIFSSLVAVQFALC